MADASKTADAILALLRGVWFPTHMSVDGRLVATFSRPSRHLVSRGC